MLVNDKLLSWIVELIELQELHLKIPKLSKK